MTQEEKDLLIKDLCARLPYGVKIELTRWVMNDGMCMNTTLEPNHINQLLNDEDGDAEIKPYLFPLSSMTDEQKQDYQYITERWMYDSSYSISDSIDWLNVHHFDCRGLIEKGLAIDATGLNIYWLWNWKIIQPKN